MTKLLTIFSIQFHFPLFRKNPIQNDIKSLYVSQTGLSRSASLIPKMALIIAFLMPSFADAQDLKKTVNDRIDAEAAHYGSIASEIWNLAELGYLEHESQAVLTNELTKNGFKIQKDVAGMPTAFIASYGQGQPVIALLAEYDALPGFSQGAEPVKQELAGQANGHACGHHLFGTAAISSAIEIKKLMEKGQLKGTIQVFGTPAEEGGSGKVYFVREGLFNDVDAVLHWHPSDNNALSAGSSLANISAKFRFKGISSHAAISPERGRSALDAVESFNFMTNMMREHIPYDTRMHYVITDGGKAPNVVPDFAEVYYYVRNSDQNVVNEVFERMIAAAKGAAMGTGTTMEVEIQGGVYNLLNNYTLTQTLAKNFKAIGGYEMTAAEVDFSKEIRKSFTGKLRAIESTQEVDTSLNKDYISFASTDVGDVSWNVPTAGFSTATWVPGTTAHSWQAVASGGMSIGNKGMVLATKVLTNSLIDFFQQPELIQKAKEELKKEQGADFNYTPLLGDRNPPLDYRK